jgi:glycosyltransferase involved in cell wall biosynthesis
MGVLLNMKNLKITVLMSVYNGEKYLREAIDSILNQTFTDFEFLIINDGSTDSSRDIILSYRDPRIRLVDNERNIGLTKSLNRGLNVARGEYIARIDADDISMPNRLDVQYNYMKDDPNLAICASSYEQIDENENSLKIIEGYLECEQLYYFHTFANWLAHSSIMFKKSIALQVNGYDDKLIRAQDYDLWYRISRMGKVIQIDEVLLKLRIHQENISSKYGNSQKYIANSVALKNIKQICNGRINTKVIEMLCEWDKEISFDDANAHTLINNLIVLNNNLIDLAPVYIDKKKLRKICWDRVYYYLILALKQKKYFSVINILCCNFLNKDFVTNVISKFPGLILSIVRRINAKS